MRAADIDLSKDLEFRPEDGTLWLGPERMVLFNQRAMHTLHDLLTRDLGETLRRAFLAQFGYRCGANDYRVITELHDWETELDRLTSGPRMHAWEGIVSVTPTAMTYDRERGHFYMAGQWRNSYEASIHLELYGRSPAPVCYSLTGYASGWGTAFFGRPVVAIEVACEACGDPCCRWEIRDVDRWGDEARPWREALEWEGHTLARELEERVRERTHELQGAMRQLEVAARAAEAANEAKSAFLAATTHELRTPVAAITGLCDILSRTSLDDEQQRYVALVRQSSEGLLNIINDVLDLSKIEADRMEIEATPFDLRELLDRAMALITTRAESKHLRLKVRVDDDTPALLEGDPTRTQQIVLNLLSNAVKFTVEGTVGVVARAHAEGAHGVLVEIAVSDTGVGISEDRLSTLFDAFEQGDASTARIFGGTGLGLTISRRLARLMGGDLTATSRLGEGSTFTASFRCRRAPEVVAMPADPAHPPPDLGTRMPLRILLVEDNPVLQLVGAKRLSQLGYKAVVASSGVEALQTLAEEAFDLVLMDIRMPVLDGIETTRELRRTLPAHLQPYVVAMTADVVTEQRERCLAAGMNDYLIKPTPMHELIAALHGAYEHRHRSSAPAARPE